MDCLDERVAYNKYGLLPYLPIRVINYLIENNEDIWKILKYTTPDALSLPSLTQEEKAEMIYRYGANQNDYHVFMQPYVEDMPEIETTQMRIYNAAIRPNNRSWGTVDICFEFISYNKMLQLNGNLNRFDVLIYNTLSVLNGATIGGIGQLSFDETKSYNNFAKLELFNNRNYSGWTMYLSVQLGDLSEA